MVFIFLCSILLTQPDSAKIKAYNDSLAIYNTYQDQIESMKKYTDSSNYNDWLKRYVHDDSATACNFVRLRKYNKKSYQPYDSLEMEGFGIAYKYPKPYGFKEKNDSLPEPENFSFTKIDLQTKFIVDEKNFTRIPYLDLLYFDGDGKLYKQEKIDPITLKKITY